MCSTYVLYNVLFNVLSHDNLPVIHIKRLTFVHSLNLYILTIYIVVWNCWLIFLLKYKLIFGILYTVQVFLLHSVLLRIKWGCKLHYPAQILTISSTLCTLPHITLHKILKMFSLRIARSMWILTFARRRVDVTSCSDFRQLLTSTCESRKS